MKTIVDVWSDPELRDLVQEDPALLAIADALAQGTPDSGEPRRRGRTIRLLALAAAVAVGAAVALVEPWAGSGAGLSARALSAIGSQPVLHVVATKDLPPSAQLVDIQTGTAVPVSESLQEEIWYDADRGLKRDVIRSGSSIIDDTLETPQGGYTPTGIIYDCAWIAAHPVEATKARVSCNASGDNGTTPRIITRAKPALDPGLAGFVDGYQQALAAGVAEEAGSGELDGEAVDWLTFETTTGTEKVALDQVTHKPVLIKDDSGLNMHIETIETLASAGAAFNRPSPSEMPAEPSSVRTKDGQDIGADPAAVAAGASGAVWAGPALDGLQLVAARRGTLVASFADKRKPTQTGIWFEFLYGTLKGNEIDRSQPFVEISEAPNRTLGLGWGFVHGDVPGSGQLYEEISHPSIAYDGNGNVLPWHPSYRGFAVVDGVYVEIQASSQDLLLQAVRSLAPVDG